MKIRCFLVAFGVLYAIHCRAAIDTIIPLPKEIHEVGEPIPLDGFRIVAAGDERSQIGATEINQRITSLGGKPLPVVRLDDKLPDGRLIVIAPCTAPELGTQLP